MPLPIPVSTLNPVWGAAYARNIQTYNLDGTIPTVWQSSDTLAATVSPGQNQPSIFAPIVTWFDAPTGKIQMIITASQTSMLSVDSEYWFQVTGTRAGTTYPLVWMRLQVIPAPGSQAAAIPQDLISLPYANQMLGAVILSPSQFEQVPTLVTAASNAIRNYCNRDFLRLTRTAIVEVQLDGTVRLGQPPINQVLLVQENSQEALTITNATATSAWVTFQTTGGLYLEGSGLNNLTPTGMLLNYQLGGQTFSPGPSVPFTANMTIGALASAIGDIGDGWEAFSDGGFDEWPVTEIYDTYSGKGAGPNDLPNGGATYHVFGSKNTSHRPVNDAGQETGIWWVGRAYSGSEWGRWGPGGFDGDLAQRVEPGKVKVTYDGGPNVIPSEIQMCAGELLKLLISRFQTDLLLDTETADKVSYRVAQEQVMALPKYILQTLARYRIFYA